LKYWIKYLENIIKITREMNFEQGEFESRDKNKQEYNKTAD
jgi:hypothetical protein